MSTTVLKDELIDIQEVVMIYSILPMQHVKLPKKALFNKNFGKSLNWQK
jgi:hypothetical protein